MSIKYGFKSICPECNEKSIWLFNADETGKNLVDCEYCGETYMIEIELIPKTTAVYKVIKQND